MANELSPMETFQEKIKGRVRESIGDLLPDEALKKIIDDSIRDAFFKKQSYSEKRADSSWPRTYEASWFGEFIKGEIEARVKIAVEAWLKEHEAEVTKLVQDMIDQGMLRALAKAIDGLFGYEFGQLGNNLVNRVRNFANQ